MGFSWWEYRPIMESWMVGSWPGHIPRSWVPFSSIGMCSRQPVVSLSPWCLSLPSFLSKNNNKKCPLVRIKEKIKSLFFSSWKLLFLIIPSKFCNLNLFCPLSFRSLHCSHLCISCLYKMLTIWRQQLFLMYLKIHIYS